MCLDLSNGKGEQYVLCAMHMKSVHYNCWNVFYYEVSLGLQACSKVRIFSRISRETVESHLHDYVIVFVYFAL